MGSKIPILDYEQFWNTFIPILDLDLQNQAVEKINLLCELLENTRKSYSLTKRRIEMLICNSITKRSCEKLLFKDVCKLKSGTILCMRDFVDGPYPVIGGSKAPIGYHNTFNVSENEIMIVKTGVAVGSVSRCKTKIFLRSGVSKVEIINEKINPSYLYYYLKFIMEEKLKRLRIGEIQLTFNKETFYDLEILVPNKEIQEIIAKKCEIAEKLMEENKRNIPLLEDEIKETLFSVL